MDLLLIAVYKSYDLFYSRVSSGSYGRAVLYVHPPSPFTSRSCVSLSLQSRA